MTDAEIAALKAKVDRLEASLAPTQHDAAAVGAWRDQQHKNAEARASGFNPFSRADLEEMERAAPTHVVRAIVGRDSHAPMGPSSAGTSGQTTRVSTSPGIIGSNTGWAREIPLSPPPGIGYVDALLEVDSARKRGELMVEEAKLKAAEPK